MPDPLPTPADRTVVIQRPGLLTYISLGFNALFLLLILIGMIHHHHEMTERPGWGGEGHMGGPGWADREGGGDFPRGDFGFMHRGWHHEGFGGPGGEGGRCEMGGFHHGFGEDRQPGFDGDHHDFAGQRPGFDDDHHDFGGPRPGGFGGGDEHFGPKTPPSAEEMTDRFMLMLTQKLSLTDPESAQIRPIVQGGIAEFQKDMEAQKQAHQKMIDDAKTKIRALLTPDQQKQFDEMTAKMGTPPAAPAAK